MNSFKLFTICIFFCLTQFSVNQLNGQSIELGSVAAELGDTVLVPLNFSGMQNIGAITLYIVYDPSSIQYLGMTNLIPQADGIIANGGYQPLLDTIAIGISWTASTIGVNFPDGKILDLRVVFNNTNSTMVFLENNCEIADWDANILTATYTSGGIYINQGATESVWTGTGNWNSEANWSNGIPGAITKATINDGTVNINSSAVSHKLIINNGAYLVIHPMQSLTVFDSIFINGNFTIKSDETGTGSMINMGEILVNGPILVERYINNNDHLISSPVDNTQASVFAGATIAGYYEPSQLWESLSPTDLLEVAQGYKISSTTGSVYNFSGNFNYGNFPVNELSYTSAGLTTYPNGMNVCGNPYPSAIAWNTGTWTKTGVDASIYTWNGSQYISWNGEIGSLMEGVIPTAQGFIAFANDMDAELGIPNDARIHSGQPFYAKEKDISNMVQFSITGNGYEDKSYLQFKYESKYGFDHEFDAYKIMGLSEAPQLYTFTNDGIKTSINVLPNISTSIDTAVRIGFKSPATDEYQIAFEVNSFGGGYDLYLKDAVLDSIQSLSSDSIYSFTSDQGLFEDRFSLYFKEPSGISEPDEWNISVYAQGDNLIVDLDEFHQKLTLEVYSIDGRVWIAHSHHNVRAIKEKLNGIKSGVYIVRLTSDKHVYSSKLFLK